MDWKKLALCAAMAGTTVACGGGSNSNGNPPVTRRYVVSAIQIPEAMGSAAVGFNLDGRVDDGSMPGCVGATPDWESVNDPGEQGVDNQLATLVPQLGMLLGDSCPSGTEPAECLSTLLAEQIAEGKLLLVMEVRDINSFANDDDVELQLYLGEVPGCDDTMPDTCVPELSGGTLAPGQDFTLTAVGAAVGGSITNGRLRAQTDSLTISIMTSDLSLDLVLHNAEVRANITDTSLSNGAIGGSLHVEDLAMAAEMIMAGSGDLVRSVLGGIADMEPQAADPDTCEAVSAGIAFSAVDAADPADSAM